jgi:acyl-CoA synthetase (AMP-forming)/AMP-acid ligase II
VLAIPFLNSLVLERTLSPDGASPDRKNSPFMGCAEATRPAKLGTVTRCVTGSVTKQVQQKKGVSTGQIAIDRERSPLYWFGGYWQQATTSCYHGHYYLTGATAELSADGTFTFVGRADDVITPVGYRIGPFEVESCLIEHPAVDGYMWTDGPSSQHREAVNITIQSHSFSRFLPSLNCDTILLRFLILCVIVLIRKRYCFVSK